jgi:hypothetical protein
MAHVDEELLALQALVGAAPGTSPGPIERRLRLSGSLEPDAAGSSLLELALTPTGLWLASTASATASSPASVTASSPAVLLPLHEARYVAHALRADRLEVAGASLSIPLARKREAREMFALGQLRRVSLSPGVIDFSGRYLDVPSVVAQAVVRAWLMPGELLLAALPTQPDRASNKSAGATREAAQLFVMSDQRLALLGWGELGDWSELSLAAGALELERSRGRRFVRRAEVSWHPSGNFERFAELDRACASSSSARILELCRLVQRHTLPEQQAELRSLFAELERRGDVTARVAQLLARLDTEPEVACVLDLSRLGPVELASLAQTWVDWQLSEALAARLLSALLQLGQAQHALPLRRALWQRQLASALDAGARLALDLEYARFARDWGAADLAAALLEQRRIELGPLSLLGAGGVGPAQHIELLDLLFELAPAASAARREAALELAQLDPLSPERFARLGATLSGGAAERARECFEVLSAQVFAPRGPAPGAECGEPRPLGKELVESRVPHPLVRGGMPLFSLLQRAILNSKSPNSDTLREYCERLEGSASPASRALAHATTALGLRRVEAYISRGLRDIGVRAFEADPPFVLVGGRHLDESSPYHLTYDELCFALGAEIAHLRLGHTRSSSSDLWLGALDKSRQGVELLIGVVPLLHGWKLAGHVLQHASPFEQHPLLRRAWEAASLLQGPASRSVAARLRRPARLDADLTAANEELLVAHRLMQLSADRAGLVIAGSLQGAVRAILLTRADYASLREPDPQLALLTALEQEVSAGSSAFIDLSVRIGALCAFYVSEDYATLRAAYLQPAP